jgi:tape measure domain-containing protein
MVASGKGADAMERALEQYKQLVRLGPEMESLKTISENLPAVDAIGIINRRFGTVDSKALRSMGVTGEKLGEALVDGILKQYGGLQAKLAAKDPAIQFSNLRGAFQRFAGELSTDIGPAISEGLGEINKAFEGLISDKAAMRDLGIPFRELADGIKGAAKQISGMMDAYRKMTPEARRAAVEKAALAVKLAAVTSGWPRPPSAV